MVNLVTGRIGDVSNDLQLGVSLGNMVSLTLRPIRGARMALVETTRSSFSDCRASIPEMTTEVEPRLGKGYSFCVLTSDGHLSRVVIDEWFPMGWESLKISFLTWSTVVQIPR